MKIKFKLLREGARIPVYATEGAAAADLFACLDGEMTLMPFERAYIPTGLAMEPERGYFAVVCARSGMASKRGLAMSNGIGVIDEDYRGEIKVPMINLSDEPQTIYAGDRIAQIMFMPVCRAEFFASDSLEDSERGEGGFGSTGVK
ncbi:MAG: dUTP diphosphatase [Clostridia bacterium]|nr:dUTP diphosphatase [Clostridia bacterium]